MAPLARGFASQSNGASVREISLQAPVAYSERDQDDPSVSVALRGCPGAGIGPGPVLADGERSSARDAPAPETRFLKP